MYTLTKTHAFSTLFPRMLEYDGKKRFESENSMITFGNYLPIRKTLDSVLQYESKIIQLPFALLKST